MQSPEQGKASVQTRSARLWSRGGTHPNEDVHSHDCQVRLALGVVDEVQVYQLLHLQVVCGTNFRVIPRRLCRQQPAAAVRQHLPTAMQLVTSANTPDMSFPTVSPAITWASNGVLCYCTLPATPTRPACCGAARERRQIHTFFIASFTTATSLLRSSAFSSPTSPAARMVCLLGGGGVAQGGVAYPSCWCC